MLYKFVIVYLGLKTCECTSLLDWLGWTDSRVPNLTYNGVPLVKVPFEELSPEDKFLVEASKIAGLELSELDACQQKLVMKLQSSCGSLSEDALAKFSVNLLNCQSAVEGRTQYPCDENMSLKECTKGMDSETWNAYHIMSNRARAVCYASRQHQFRALSEMTVNRLMAAMHTHIEALTSLQEENSKLKSGGGLTLQQIERAQISVLSRQKSLASVSRILSKEQNTSLSLTRAQQDLLQSYKKEISSLAKLLNNKLTSAGQQVTENSGLTQKGHEGLMKDLGEIAEIVDRILAQIDNSSKRLLDINKVVVDQFSEALANMKEINSAVSQVLSISDSIKRHSDYISFIIGEEGERLGAGLELGAHGLALSIAMTVSSFLEVPLTSRVLLLVAAPLNTYLALQGPEYPSATLLVFYLSFALLILCDWSVRLMKRQWEKERAGVPRGVDTTDQRNNLNHVTPRRNLSIGAKVNNWLSETRKHLEEEHPRPTNGYLAQNHTHPDDIYEVDTLDGSVRRSSRRTRSITPSRSVRSRNDGRLTCLSILKTGQRCKKYALPDSLFCGIHKK